VKTSFMLLTPGNRKLGRSLIWTFNLPSATESGCPGSTPLCRRLCYARRLELYRPRVRLAYARNLRISRRRDFARRVVSFSRAHFIRVVRLHSGGDFFSRRYARKWLWVMRRLRRVRFFFYTRCWRVPEIRPELEAMAALPNCFAWYSCDAETGVPTSLPPRVRLAWLQTSKDDPPPAGVDLIFRDHALRRKPVTPLQPLARVCPEQDGVERSTPVTCQQCQSCFREPARPANAPGDLPRQPGPCALSHAFKARGPPFLGPHHLCQPLLKGDARMGARKKLNQGYLTGTLLAAAALGGLAGSWLVFAVAAGIGVCLNVLGGDLRGPYRREP
jgi:hypothetical protein